MKRSWPILLAFAVLPASSTAHADTKSECVAASDQAQQLRDDGKYQRARTEFQVCARDACPKVVSRLCAQWLEELDQNMPTVVLAAKDEHGLDVADARALLDGTPLVSKLDGKPVAIDPGEHVVRVERAGSVAAEQKVVVRAGEKSRVITVTLATAASQPLSEQASSRIGIADADQRPAPSTARIVTTVALAALAVGGVAVGIFEGLQSNSEADSAATIRGSMPATACASTPSPACQNLSDAVDAQNRDALLSKVFYVAGGAVAVGAVVAYLLWPPAAQKRTVDTAHVWFAPSAGGGWLGAGASF